MTKQQDKKDFKNIPIESRQHFIPDVFTRVYSFLPHDYIKSFWLLEPFPIQTSQHFYYSDSRLMHYLKWRNLYKQAAEKKKKLSAENFTSLSFTFEMLGLKCKFISNVSPSALTLNILMGFALGPFTKPLCRTWCTCRIYHLAISEEHFYISVRLIQHTVGMKCVISNKCGSFALSILFKESFSQKYE